MKRHEVQLLLSAGHSHRKVARLADVSKRAVTRIAQEPTIEGLGGMGVARDRRFERPSRTGEFREPLLWWAAARCDRMFNHCALAPENICFYTLTGSPRTRSRDAPMVCTVGYQLRSLAELVGHLRQAEIDVVIDVREKPWSHVRGYREPVLREALAAEGIGYVHAPFAGNPQRLRREANSHAECLALYREHLDSNPEIASRFAELLHALDAQNLNVCLLCYERHPEDCHRQLLIQALGLEASVRHIAPEGAPRFLKA